MTGAEFRVFNLFQKGDRVIWSNGRTFEGTILAKVKSSARINPEYLKDLEARGFHLPKSYRSVAKTHHRLIVEGENKRIHFVILGQAEKIE